MKKYLLSFLFFICCQLILANEAVHIANTVIFSNSKTHELIGHRLSVLEDKTNTMSLIQVMKSSGFIPGRQVVPNFGVSNSSFWLRCKIKNNSTYDHLLLDLANPTIDEVDCYSILNGKCIVKTFGEYQPFYLRDFDYPSYVFNLHVPAGETIELYLRVKSREQITLPLKLGTQIEILDTLSEKNLLFGFYIGIMLAMFFYNAFIYLTTKDRNYLYYIIYIIAVGLTQSCFQGYTFQFLWSNSPWMAQNSIVFLSAFVGVSAAEFARLFLNTNQYLKSVNKVLYVFYFSYLVCIILTLIGKNSIPLIDITALAISLYLLVVAAIIARKGYRPAKFFLIAWIIFLVGVIVFALKNIGILPYSNFTIYTMPAGSAIEAILLSFALADRINILKKEKEESQKFALDALLINEKLIKEQNIILEQKVKKRTIELEHTNEELTTTLSDLKNAQAQLVSVEKMASLGQLTAGIAHEINNPINFVGANVKPLKLDIDDVLDLVEKYESLNPKSNESEFKEIEDYKKTIDYDYIKKEMAELLSGIEEGAKRTAEIVRGLKNFSRLDESDIKTVNINEGIESTLVLLRNIIPDDTKLIVELGDISKIECLPGKLNQVFMNLINNAIYALNKVEGVKEKVLIIKTFEKEEHIHVVIEDTGIGMTPEIKSKIFDPFFTTKEVGEGTGLGMSIVFKILESHQAKIDIDSEAGKGTRITLILNKKINLS